MPAGPMVASPIGLMALLLLWPGSLASETTTLPLPVVGSTAAVAPGGRLPSAGADLVGAALTQVGSGWLAVGAPTTLVYEVYV